MNLPINLIYIVMNSGICIFFNQYTEMNFRIYIYIYSNPYEYIKFSINMS